MRLNDVCVVAVGLLTMMCENVCCRITFSLAPVGELQFSFTTRPISISFGL